MRVACVLLTHLRDRDQVEMQRQPQPANRAVLIADGSQGRFLAVDRFPAARRAADGMPPEQTLSRQKDGAVLEADESACRRVFVRMPVSLQGVSDRDASGPGGTKPMSLPVSVAVREGPEGGPAAVLLEEKWRRVARIDDLWCFDLWWMPEPLTRTYYRAGKEDGGEVTLFLDQRSDRWFRQDS